MSNASKVMWGGEAKALMGDEIKVGDKAPDFEALGLDMSPRKLSDFAGKTLILSSVPSLETSVCDTETRRFNQIAASLGDDVNIVTVSMDLPFTQKRWCGAAGIDKVTVLSDHRDASFGTNYGVLISGLRLLARCVFVVDKQGTVRYRQLVEKTGTEPNYDDVIEAVKKIL
jgi:thiol peroxidase